MSNDLKLLNSLKVGIVGCGHLGQAIAQSLVRQGLERKNLLLSYGGNPHTYQKLEEQALLPCLTTNQQIFQEAGIVLITIKPQDLPKLKAAAVSEKTLIVSCMAGVPLELLNRILGTKIHRMMFSGPDTLLSEKGVATMYPEHEYLKSLLRFMNLTHIKTITENDMDVFTAGVCMPVAILKEKNPVDQQNSINKIGAKYPLLPELYTWAIKVLPSFENDADKETYAEKMITKGGITEAIIKSLINGAPFDTALQKGIDRSKEISKEIQQSVIADSNGTSATRSTDGACY